MAQTITTITNAANLGGNTSITVGSPTKTTLAGATQWVVLNAQISAYTEQFSSNAGSSVARPTVKLWYAISPFTLTADKTLPSTLGQEARFLEIRLLPNGTGVVCRSTGSLLNGSDDTNSGVLANNGGLLYTWFESPPLSPINNTPPTITITSVEF